ncbi:hypothetical protein [Chromobacterium haemolyticum]|uniref:hypothetical protein n=1 Tax=Chromobacterium haemolyticum TaxID=394935 RepID=UPI0005BA7100|nr:hypothetical protein [Chromobacterium haemolyticum]
MITKEQLATEATSGRAFAVVDDIVHDPDRHFEELQWLALTMASHIDAQAARIAELEQDAARYRWLTQDAYIGECFTERGTVLEICGTDREIPVYHERSTDRDEVDAAIDAAMMIQGCSSG